MTSRLSEALRPVNFDHGIGLIASSLIEHGLEAPDFNRPLELLCNCLPSTAAAFFLIQSTKASTEMVRRMHWEAMDEASIDLEWQHLPQSARSALIRLSVSRISRGPGDSVKLLLPIGLRSQLCGVLAVSGDDAGAFQRRDVETFLKSVGSVFELWIAKVDASRRLQDFIDFVPDPVIGLDAAGIPNIWNPAAARMTGWEPSRVIGRGNYEHALPFYGVRRPIVPNLILRPEPQWEATYGEYRKEGDNVYCLNFLPELVGGGGLVNGTTRRIRDINGRIIGAWHVIQDITRERNFESRLQSSESMFKTITEYAGLGIALFRGNKALYCNERFRELLGGSDREITLLDVYNTTHSDDTEKIRLCFARMIAGNERGPLRSELRVLVNGRQRFYSSYAQMLDYEGQPTICFILDDTTEQKELAQRARVTELKMYHEGRLTSLGIMAAGIAHELNQPLNTIRVITDGILFGKEQGWALDPGDVYEDMQMVSDQVVRMAGVIQSIRNFSREEQGQAFIDVDVNMAIRNVFSMIGRQFEAHDIIVEQHLAQRLPPITGDLNRLEQVVMNLMVNARQALDGRRGREKYLTIRSGMRNGKVRLEVTDNATGVSEENKDRLFDPFFTTKDVGQGTGLGLTISRSIVKEFNGEIGFYNNERGGATFYVNLPVGGGHG